jgi:hypothetical protein
MILDTSPFKVLLRKVLEYPVISIIFGYVVVAVFSVGIMNLKMETDPDVLLSTPSSESYKQGSRINNCIDKILTIDYLQYSINHILGISILRSFSVPLLNSQYFLGQY